LTTGEKYRSCVKLMADQSKVDMLITLCEDEKMRISREQKSLWPEVERVGESYLLDYLLRQGDLEVHELICSADLETLLAQTGKISLCCLWMTALRKSQKYTNDGSLTLGLSGPGTQRIIDNLGLRSKVTLFASKPVWELPLQGVRLMVMDHFVHQDQELVVVEHTRKVNLVRVYDKVDQHEHRQRVCEETEEVDSSGLIYTLPLELLLPVDFCPTPDALCIFRGFGKKSWPF
jgi:hypothetical protein